MNKKLLKNFCAVFLAGFMALLLLPQSAQAQKKDAYVVKSSDKKTLTFYYDAQKSSRTGTVWGIDETKEEDQETFPAWAGTMYTAVPEVTTIVFDNSFKNFRPKTTKNWFFNFTNLEEIKGLENLNSSEVTIMSGMFVDCEKLSQLNLSSFNTEKVQDMSGMFADNTSLQTIYCNNTWTCALSNEMFYNCTSLKGAVRYNANKEDVSMANPNTGYFTKK